MNKKIAILLTLLLAAMPLTGCSNTVAGGSDRMHIVCTIFPEYDWIRQILGEHAQEVEVTYLLSGGSDLHSYQPTAADMVQISSCDMFVYVGGESEHWVADALSESVNPDMQVIRLLDIVQAKEEELAEGMEAEEEDEEEPELDEHVWLSVRNAQVICSELTESLKKLDPPNAEDYQKNFNAYQTELIHLDEDFVRCYSLSSGVNHTLIFGDRFPFRYFVDDYGYQYYAAFAGCSAETEASFETIAFLAKQLEAPQNVCTSIYVIEGGSHAIAEAVVENTQSKNYTIRELNSLQSVTEAQIQEGATYISLMRENLNQLKEASGQS